MNLTLHLVRTDLVRMRAWIACWVGVLLVPIAIGVAVLARSPFPGGHGEVPNMLAIVTGAEVLVAYLLTVLLFQEHPLIGTTQFWLTRPISRGRLLATKVIGALIMVALPPVVVALPWWLWCGFGPVDIAGAAAETLVVMLLIVLGGAAMAVLTETFGRALLWTVAFVAIGLFAMFLFTGANSMEPQDSAGTSLIATRTIVAAAAVALELAVVIVLQFFLRRRGLWLAWAAAAIVATLLVSVQARWMWFGQSEPREIEPSRASGAAIQVDRASVPPPRQPAVDSRPGPWRTVEISGVVTGFDPELSVMGVGARQSWRLDEGVAISRASTVHTLDSAMNLNRERDVRFFTRPSLPHSIVARLRAEPSAYEARLWFRLGRLQRWFEAPLAPSPWLTHRPNRMKIARGSPAADAVRVEFVETKPHVLRREFVAASRFRTWLSPVASPQFAIIDRDQGRMAWLRSNAVRHAVVSGVAITWHDATPATRDGRVLWMRLWPALGSPGTGLTFAALAWQTESQFARDVKVPRLEFTK